MKTTHSLVAIAITFLASSFSIAHSEEENSPTWQEISSLQNALESSDTSVTINESAILAQQSLLQGLKEKHHSWGEKKKSIEDSAMNFHGGVKGGHLRSSKTQSLAFMRDYNSRKKIVSEQMKLLEQTISLEQKRLNRLVKNKNRLSVGFGKSVYTQETSGLLVDSRYKVALRDFDEEMRMKAWAKIEAESNQRSLAPSVINDTPLQFSPKSNRGE